MVVMDGQTTPPPPLITESAWNFKKHEQIISRAHRVKSHSPWEIEYKDLLQEYIPTWNISDGSICEWMNASLMENSIEKRRNNVSDLIAYMSSLAYVESKKVYELFPLWVRRRLSIQINQRESG